MAAPQHGNKVIPNVSMVINTYDTFLIASDTFVDPEGDAITYSVPGTTYNTAVKAYIGGPLPTGVRFKGVPSFYGTPSVAAAAGDYPITLNATSVDGTDSLQFTLHLGAAGQNVPSFGAEPTTGELYSVGPYTVGNYAAAGVTIGQPVTATDAGGNLLPAPYSIKWSSDNSVGDAYGINRSPIAINETTGQLYVNGTIDYNTMSQYTLIVEVEDSSSPVHLTNVAKVVINVDNSNTMWCFTPSPVLIIME